MRNKLKQNKGITLIALVITIIVLLILAGISIVTLTGENGVLTKANSAKLETRGGEVQELVNMWKSENAGGEYIEWNVADEDQFIQKLLDDKKIFEEELNRENKTIIIGKKVIDYSIKDDNNYIGLTTMWKVDTANGSITFPLLGDYNVEIDWGDGGNKEKFEGTNVTQESSQPNHIYKEPGDYNISVTGKYDKFGAIVEHVSFPLGNLDNLIEVLSWGDNQLKSVSFANAKNLMYVTEPKDGILKDLLSCNYMFYGCKSLKTIPKGTFKDCRSTTSFNYTFERCSALENIPEGLFDNCTNVTSFGNIFGYCSSLANIPEGLFDNCTNVTSFSGTFEHCSSLTSIPEGLFDNCTDVTSFCGTFDDCSSLTNIPEGLFDNCANVENFYATFSDCANVEGNAPDIFTRTNVTSHDRCFYNCTKLSNYNKIPADWKSRGW